MEPAAESLPGVTVRDSVFRAIERGADPARDEGGSPPDEHDIFRSHFSDWVDWQDRVGEGGGPARPPW